MVSGSAGFICFGGKRRYITLEQYQGSTVAQRVPAKGQVTVPKRVRDHLGVAASFRQGSIS
jgi:hypothetical protein